MNIPAAAYALETSPILAAAGPRGFPAQAGTAPNTWLPRARIALTAFVALTVLPMLLLASLAFAGVLTGDDLQAVTPGLMMLPALAAVTVWACIRPAPFGRALRLRPDRGWVPMLGWSFAALLAIAALGVVTAELAVVAGFAARGTEVWGAMAAVPGVFSAMLVLSVGEEFGWRGFAQRLLAPVGLVRSSLLIAVLWALWHAPVMAVWVWEGSMTLAVALTTLGSLVLGGIVLSVFAALGGSIWPAVVGHAAMNSLVVAATSTWVAGDAAAIGMLGWLPWAVAAAAGLLLGARVLRGHRR